MPLQAQETTKRTVSSTNSTMKPTNESEQIISLLSPDKNGKEASHVSDVANQHETNSTQKDSAFRRLVTKETALSAIKKLSKNEECLFSLLPFNALTQKNLKSKVYHHYNSLCHINTKSNAGWAVCKYVVTGACKAELGCLKFDSVNGTTNVFRHIKTHEKPNSQSHHARSIGNKAKREMCNASAHVVIEDLRPFSFPEGCGMRHFIESVFKAGQAVPVGDTIDAPDFIPSAKAVHRSVEELSLKTQREFKEGIENVCEMGGGMSIDGVQLQTQDKHFYDLTVHYFDFSRSGMFSSQRPTLRCRTNLLAEAGDGHTASDIRQLLNNQLTAKYQCDLGYISRFFTLVTDWAAVMPNIVGASVSENVAPINENWMGCIAHQLNTAMKFCFKLIENDEFLKRLIDDLNSVKTLVRIFKKAGWNHELGDGNHLVQEVETRFDTTFEVISRFLKTGVSAFSVVDRRGTHAARKAKDAILMVKDTGSHLWGFPALEAITDACDMIVFIQKQLEGGATPTIHLVLPMLQKCDDELRRIELGGVEVERGFSRGKIRPSEYSINFCGLMRPFLREKVVVHDLWLAASILHPFMRELQFIEPSRRREYKNRGEAMVRKLYKAFGGVEETEEVHGTGQDTLITREQHGMSAVYSIGEPTGRKALKRKFELMDFADSHFDYNPAVRADEILRYMETDILKLNLDKKRFMKDDFAAIQFWSDNRKQYPTLFKVAVKVFATPVSSCSSERVFSAVKRIGGTDRARIGSKSLEDIILVRSALSNTK